MARQADSDMQETEHELVLMAQNAVSQCNWVVGECAFKWTKKYAQGRTDADFGALIGLSGDQVYQRRRVWETFGEVHGEYPSLRWSHFYVALNWDDALECLAWAVDNSATVSEMRAWRRVQRGEDLAGEPPAADWSGDPSVSFVPTEPKPVRDPASFGAAEDRPRAGSPIASRPNAENSARPAGVARESESQDADYAPYRRGAGSPAPREETSDVAVAEKPKPPAAQVIKRVTKTLERVDRALTPEMLQEFRRLPEGQRHRLVSVISALGSKIAKLV